MPIYRTHKKKRWLNDEQRANMRWALPVMAIAFAGLIYMIGIKLQWWAF